MKNVMVALLCTLGAVAACSDRKPAESPTTTTSGTTTTTVTEAPLANTNAPIVGDTNAAGNAPATANATSGVSGNGAVSNGQPVRSYPQPSPVSPLGAASTDGSNGANGAAVATTSGTSSGDPNATNTKTNERDRNGAALTPMDQGGGKDRDITAAVRRSVVGDSSLSFNAKNVKIITQNGKVTLRGPVKTDAEKATIEAKTRAAAGVVDVDNQLEVKK